MEVRSTFEVKDQGHKFYSLDGEALPKGLQVSQKPKRRMIIIMMKVMQGRITCTSKHICDKIIVDK